MVRPTAPAFSVAPITATALGLMNASKSRVGSPVRVTVGLSVSVIILGSLFCCPAISGVWRHSHADDGAWRLPDDRISVCPQPAQHSIFDAAPDHQKIGVVVQRGGAHRERH